MGRKKCIAMILAGGQGSRLGALTTKEAKPAVGFGGKYKIIDFTLSNVSNSGIDTVGILTQYQPLDLNTYVGNGKPWDLDSNNGGVFILPPYQSSDKGEWYKGTANAIYQNFNFIEKFNPDNVLILSGDHIYKMNYAKMLDSHLRNNADCTIATITVPLEEASRFGILLADKEGRITEFEEKPENPSSDQASMGIYIFKWETLKNELQLDEANKDSSNDFGKNIIPQMLAKKERLFIYNFNDYWKDVGTISSLWQANMDILDEKCTLNISDPNWPIMAKVTGIRSQYLGADANVVNSLITEGCEINGIIKHSILSYGVNVGRNSFIKDSIIMENVQIGDDVYINKSIIGKNTVIENGCQINAEEISTPEFENLKICSDGISVIGPDVVLKKNFTVGTLCQVTKENVGGKKDA